MDTCGCAADGQRLVEFAKPRKALGKGAGKDRREDRVPFRASAPQQSDAAPGVALNRHQPALERRADGVVRRERVLFGMKQQLLDAMLRTVGVASQRSTGVV